jgi:GxxExxY protein
MKHQELTGEIINAAFEVHNTLGFGFLEIVYERALLLELQNRGLKAESQLPVRVFYKEQEVGTYKVDILVENEIVLELKAITTLRVEDELQLVNYLQATKKEIGLLINFGSQKVEFKRKYRIYKEKKR